jgi:uncharacterized membrane protein
VGRFFDWGQVRHLVETRAGRVLAGSAAAIAVLTVAGLVALWPYGWSGDDRGGLSQTIRAGVDRVTDAPCLEGASQDCRTLAITVEGRHERLLLGPTRIAPRVSAGDAIRVIRPGSPDVRPEKGAPVIYEFAEVERRGSLAWIAVAVTLAAVAVLRLRGLLAVVGVVISLAVVLFFLVPAILAGKPALLVALVAALAVMFVTLILTNGLGAQTMAAVLGVSATLVLTCLVAALAARFAHLDGTTGLATIAVKSQAGAVSLRGVILAGMLIGALGVLADTAVTQASAVMALRRAAPGYDSRRLYREAFVIGRDHLSATIHTLVLAYAGATLPLLLVLRSSGTPTGDALNGQSVAEPLVATGVGCLALIAAVPLTTALAAWLIARVPADAVPEAHAH